MAMANDRLLEPVRAQIPTPTISLMWIAVVRASETGLLGDLPLDVDALAIAALVVLRDPADIVVNLHDACERPEFRERCHAYFYAGPSATADVESVLIHCAQGVRSLRVLPIPPQLTVSSRRDHDA
jgi:hypothetical protein